MKAFFLAATVSVCLLNNAYAITGIDELKSSEKVANNPTTTATPAVTSQESQALLNVLYRAISRDLTTKNSQNTDQSELELLKRLQTELGSKIQNPGQEPVLKGTIQANETQALKGDVKSLQAKNDELSSRVSLLEKTQVHGDVTFGVLSDFARRSANEESVNDALSSIGRVRLTIDVPVREDQEDSKLGAGTFHSRLIGAFGRYSPISPSSGATYPFNLYSRISADASAFNEGLGTGSVGDLFGLRGNTFMTRPNIFLESTFYKQHLKAGIPVLTDPLPNARILPEGRDFESSGDLYVGLIRWWDLFDISPYRGNELTQFQNNAFINIPGIAVNTAQPMVAYAYHQGLGKRLSLDLTSAVGSPDVGDMMDALNVTYEARLNYNTGFLGEKFEKAGSLYAGGYNIFTAGQRRIQQYVSSLNNRSGGTYPGLGDKDTSSSVYVGWNQEWFKGIGTNVGYLLNQNSSNIAALTTLQPGPAFVAAGARHAFSSVVQVPMTAFSNKFRAKDTLGLGYAFVDIQDGGLTGLSEGLEHVLEAYYKVHLTDQLAVYPSWQIIFNRLGLERNQPTNVVGLRMSYSF
jgi:hypothetical protein